MLFSRAGPAYPMVLSGDFAETPPMSSDAQSYTD